MNSFNDLILPESVQRALVAMKYATPTEIQAKAIPAALSGHDVVGSAQTGTGKTAAFSIPLITSLISEKRKRALILAPTRELALQINEVLNAILKFTSNIQVAVLIGGASMGPQERALSKKPRIIVATPGRLCDHLRRKTVALNQTDVLVLDEADRMLDMGFAAQLNEIVRFLPKERQTLLFSATFPGDIQKLVSRYTRNPVRVSAGPVSKPVDAISQSVINTTGKGKNDALVDELNTCKGSILVFARTKRRTDKLARYLGECGYKVGRIHGDRSQKQRLDAIDGFKRGRFTILVATDIAARGIDIPHIANVINYDLPSTPEDYVHRIGRTGRAGAVGRAVSLLTAEDQSQWRSISKLITRTAVAK